MRMNSRDLPGPQRQGGHSPRGHLPPAPLQPRLQSGSSDKRKATSCLEPGRLNLAPGTQHGRTDALSSAVPWRARCVLFCSASPWQASCSLVAAVSFPLPCALQRWPSGRRRGRGAADAPNPVRHRGLPWYDMARPGGLSQGQPGARCRWGVRRQTRGHTQKLMDREGGRDQEIRAPRHGQSELGGPGVTAERSFSGRKRMRWKPPPSGWLGQGHRVPDSRLERAGFSAPSRLPREKRPSQGEAEPSQRRGQGSSGPGAGGGPGAVHALDERVRWDRRRGPCVRGHGGGGK